MKKIVLSILILALFPSLSYGQTVIEEYDQNLINGWTDIDEGEYVDLFFAPTTTISEVITLARFSFCDDAGSPRTLRLEHFVNDALQGTSDKDGGDVTNCDFTTSDEFDIIPNFTHDGIDNFRIRLSAESGDWRLRHHTTATVNDVTFVHSTTGTTTESLTMRILSGTTTSATTSNQTEIIYVQPEPDSQGNATSTDFEFNIVGNVLPEDFTDDLYIHGAFWQITGVGEGDNSQERQEGTYRLELDTSGGFDLSTTTSMLNTGWYSAWAALRKPRFEIFGFQFFHDDLDEVYWQFELATSTAEDQELANKLLFTQSPIGNASTTQSRSEILSCNFVSDFSWQNCLELLLVPTGTELADSMSELRAGFLSVFPIGYATRVVEILGGNSTTTVMLPDFTATLFAGTGEEETFYLSMDDMFIGGVASAGSVTDLVNGKTFQDVFQTWIRTLLGISIVFIIAFDVMRARPNLERA